MTNRQVRLGFVVTTLGRIDLLDTLLLSMLGQTVEGDRVVIVAQGNYATVEELVSKYKELPISLMSSPRGAALGRNVGAESLQDLVDVLHFPSDSSWFPPGMIEPIRRATAHAGFVVGGMSVVDHLGPKLAVPPEGTALDRNNLWRVIEMGLLIRADVFFIAGGFDPEIGTGSSTPWQAGEVSDLLLRLLADRPDLARAFRWLPTSVWIGGVAEGHGLSKEERRHKVRAYGRGLGWVARRHGYSLTWKLKRLAGGLLIGYLRPGEYGLLDGCWAFLGRLEGLLGITWRSSNAPAVSR
jgi:hypothetical protein